MPAAAGGDLVGDLGGSLKIVTLLDHLDAERAHRCIFLSAVIDGNDDCSGNTILPCRKPDRLPVIPSRCRDDAGGLRTGSAQIVHVNESATDFEGTGGSVVFVLYPDRRSDPRIQKRPPILWRRRHRAVDQLRGRLEISQ